jgi:4-hydroxy-tetrahydrodipicolinate reductase
MTRLKIAIAGAGGKMGSANIRAVLEHSELDLVGTLDRPGAPAVGKDAGSVAGLSPASVMITDDLSVALASADALIDFTSPAGSVALAHEAAKRGLIHVIGTTGCSTEDDAAIQAAAAAGARIVKAGNFSLGVNTLLGLIEQAAKALPEWDIEILEMHHNKKVDAPSGTALMLGEAAAKGRGVDLAEQSVRSRDGHTGARVKGTIGFATLRGGNVIGEHSVILAGPSERITLGHIADNRALFAEGALRTALWARDKAAGFYNMADVLGFSKKDS